MQFDELKNLRIYKKEIVRRQNQINNLKSSYPNSRKSDTILDLQEVLNKAQHASRKEELKITKFIESIENPKIRLIFSYHFIDGFSWTRIAKEIGAGETEKSVKRICFNYMKKHNKGSDNIC